VDFFGAICQGLGFATAVGIVIGAAVPQTVSRLVVLAVALPLGVLVCAAALDGADEIVWPAIPAGGLAALIGALASSGIVAGASRRPEASPPGVALLVTLVAVALAIVSLVLPPVSLVAIVALSWLIIARRGREERKHEGLRVLR
jgi:hypothetical protein